MFNSVVDHGTGQNDPALGILRKRTLLLKTTESKDEMQIFATL